MKLLDTALDKDYIFNRKTWETELNMMLMGLTEFVYIRHS